MSILLSTFNLKLTILFSFILSRKLNFDRHQMSVIELIIININLWYTMIIITYEIGHFFHLKT